MSEVFIPFQRVTDGHYYIKNRITNKEYYCPKKKVAKQLCDEFNSLVDENKQLRNCIRQLSGRSISIDGICSEDCQFARHEVMGHGDIKWICALQRPENHVGCCFGETCSFLEGLEPIKDLTECVEKGHEKKW